MHLTKCGHLPPSAGIFLQEYTLIHRETSLRLLKINMSTMKFYSPNSTGISPNLLLANFSLGPQRVLPSYLGKKNTSTQFDIDLCGTILDTYMSFMVVVSCQSLNVLYPICTPFRLSLTRRKNVCAVRRPSRNQL